MPHHLKLALRMRWRDSISGDRSTRADLGTFAEQFATVGLSVVDFFASCGAFFNLYYPQIRL
jgi:hypothetical protein